MALGTATEIITEIKAHYKGIDTSTAQSYAIVAFNELCKEIAVVNQSVSLGLTADTGIYPFASGSPWYLIGTGTTTTALPIIKISSVYYLADSTSRIKLIETSPDELDIKFPEWRYQDSGTPQYVFIENDNTGVPQMGIYPAPDTTSSPATGAGYPRVDARYRAKYGDSFTGSTAVPPTISDPLVIVYGALWRIHARENNGALGPHYQLYMSAKTKLGNEISNRLKSNRNSISPNVSTPTVR
jgi:hypothetical protein